MQEVVKDFQGEAKEIIERKINKELERISYLILKKVMDFFAKEGLHYHQDQQINLQLSPYDPKELSFPSSNLMGIIHKVIMSMTTLIVAEICGGTGIALLAAGPLGWFLGAILGLLGGYIGGKKAESYLKDFHFPAFLTSIIIRPKILHKLVEKGKKDFEVKVVDYLKEEMESIKEEIIGELKPAILKELESLSLMASLIK